MSKYKESDGRSKLVYPSSEQGGNYLTSFCHQNKSTNVVLALPFPVGTTVQKKKKTFTLQRFFSKVSHISEEELEKSLQICTDKVFTHFLKKGKKKKKIVAIKKKQQ